MLSPNTDEIAEATRRTELSLAVLGHELRNAVVPLVTGFQVLRESFGDAQVNPTIIRTCAVMERQTQHLTRLIEDMQDVSRIRSGRLTIKKGPVSLQEIVEHAVATSEPLIDECGHQLSVHLPPAPVVISGDRARLVQVVANLLNNAARYTDRGGSIRIECRVCDNHAEICVVDNGHGISPAFLPHLFENYQRERDAVGGGLGLGLAIAKDLVKMHEGTLSVTSEGIGRGTQCLVRLPISEEPGTIQQPAPLEHASNLSEAKPLSIVLVDDDADVLEIMQALLVLWGHQVNVTRDGEAGVELIQRLEPDIALIDLGLGEFDGYDVAARIRSRGRSRTRLIALSGIDCESERERAFEAGFEMHLVKPVQMDRLRDVLSAR